MLSLTRCYALMGRIRYLGDHRLIGSIQHVFFILAVASVGLLAWASRESLELMVQAADQRWLCLALVVLVTDHMFAPAMVQRVLRGSARPLSFREAFGIYGRRLPARYLPGGIWHAVSTTLDYHSYGVQSRYLLAVNLLQMTLINGFSFLLGGAGLALARQGTIWEPLGVFGALGGLVTILAAAIYVPRLLRVHPPTDYLPDLFFVAATMLAMLVIFALGLVFYLAAFPGMIRGVGTLELFSVLMFARGVGFIAFFAPKGVGVFEAVSAGMLGTSEAFAPLVVVLAGFRLLQIVVDAVIWVSAIFVSRGQTVPSREKN